MARSPKAVRQALRNAAAKRAESDRLRSRATKQTVAAVRAGFKAGLTASEIADLAGMSRPALYEMMDRHGVSRAS